MSDTTPEPTPDVDPMEGLYPVAQPRKDAQTDIDGSYPLVMENKTTGEIFEVGRAWLEMNDGHVDVHQSLNELGQEIWHFSGLTEYTNIDTSTIEAP